MSVIRVKSASIMRNDTAQNWVDKNPTLCEGEEGYETDTRRRKVGDGVTAWSSLPYDDAVVTAVLANVGALTLIDSVTLTEEVGTYSKTLPQNTYRELYVTAEIKLGGTIANNLVRFVVQDGNRVCGADYKCSANQTVYAAAHIVTLPGKGHAGILGVGITSWINATTSMSPGWLDSETQDGYIRKCTVMVSPSYANTGTATMGIGTKIMIWGR